MPEKATPKIESLLNVAILLVAVGICVALTTVYRSRTRARHELPSIVGKNAAVPNINWQDNRRTLLLVLQRGCHFCTESAPFYQRLARDVAGDGGVRLVAVLPHPPDEGKQYVDTLGVTVDKIIQASAASLGVSGTPTLILVDSTGLVTNVWIGKLTPEKEEDVFERLRS